MAEDEREGPRVAPGLPKGSGSKAPWIVLAVVLVAVFALIASVVIAVFLLRS